MPFGSRIDTGNSDGLGAALTGVEGSSADTLATAASDNGVLSRTQARGIIARCVSNLGAVAGNLNLFVAQAELDSAPLQRLGFRSVNTINNCLTAPHNVDAQVIVSLGTDATPAQRTLHALNGLDNTPTVLVVMVVPFEEDAAKVPAQRYIDMANRMSRVRAFLYDSGADDVMCLFGDEVLTPHRMLESIQKSEYMATKMRDIVDAEVGAVEDKAARKFQQAHRRFLMMLPGRILANIPYEDEHLREWRAESGSLVGVGDCKFTSKLGAGAFGHVFKSEHPTRGSVAIKIISKKSVKNANMLFSLDRELCHMLYSEPHPNIVRAFEVMHGMHNFYIVMEYGGMWHLQRFVKMTLERSGQATLPAEQIKSFCVQQASAMSHLHSFLVCHRDLKPDNWIVSEDGSAVRLTDFGLTTQLSGPTHPLRQSCGSLPFCAPEVFNSESNELDFGGYDGLAADVWSLGVNYMELVCGPYSIEKLLGWLPQHPKDHEAIVSGLQSLAERWAGIVHQEKVGLGNTISNMVVLQPSQRWKMAQVLGVQSTTSSLLPRPPRTGRQHLRKICAPRQNSEDAESYRSEGPPPPDPGQGNDGALLTVRLGGVNNVRLAINRMLDNFLWNLGFGDIFNANPRQFSTLRDIYLEDACAIFDTDSNSPHFQAIRDKVKLGHEGLPMLDAHFSLLLEHFETALRHYELSDAVIQEAVQRLATFRPEASASCREMLDNAARTNTAAWRSNLLDDLQTQQISGFAETLRKRISESPVLNETSLQHRSAAEIEAHVLMYLNSGVGALKGPIQFPDEELSKVAHLVLVNLARDAFAAAGWAATAVELLHLAMLQEWEHAH